MFEIHFPPKIQSQLLLELQLVYNLLLFNIGIETYLTDTKKYRITMHRDINSFWINKRLTRASFRAF